MVSLNERFFFGQSYIIQIVILQWIYEAWNDSVTLYATCVVVKKFTILWKSNLVQNSQRLRLGSSDHTIEFHCCEAQICIDKVKATFSVIFRIQHLFLYSYFENHIPVPYSRALRVLHPFSERILNFFKTLLF